MDGCTTGFSVLDQTLATLTTGNVSIPGGGAAGSPGGSFFIGFVSDSANIARIIFSETDGNSLNPDSNIGYDWVLTEGGASLTRRLIWWGGVSASLSA